MSPMSSSCFQRYEILQDDVDALLERIEASLDLVKKKKNQVCKVSIFFRA